MNAIGGFAPSEGTIRILGKDASPMTPANRAGFGALWERERSRRHACFRT
ncbi:MAG: hypothetical protein CM1200mP26_10750 [Acidimicrobiales bacterium]|nr:MAG: hypothetical protein CM1200mP26_10750 [Acidimicrobiales bacterium]